MKRDSIIVVCDKKRDVDKKRDEWISKMGEYGFITESKKEYTGYDVEYLTKACRQ